MAVSGHVVLDLFPPYSIFAGSKRLEIPLRAETPAEDFFQALCRRYPALRELMFPSGPADFPGPTLVLRDGVPIGRGQTLLPGDVLKC